MCRILAYSGAPIAIGDLLCDPGHSLLAQSYQPREMSSGVVNADGYGFAWYDAEKQAEPFTYRSVLPIWNDVNLASLGRYVRTAQLLAYVRSATPGQALDISNTQPFVFGRWSFVHNGFVEGFDEPAHRRVWRALRQRLSDDADALIAGRTDSVYLFAWLAHHLDDADPAGSVADALDRLTELAAGMTMTMNFVLGDGARQIVVRHALGAEPPSLYILDDDPAHPGATPGATIVASEPLFESGAWRPLDANTLITIDAHRPSSHHVQRLAA